MTADDKYSLLNKDILTQPIKMQLSKKQKPFHESFSAFFNLAQILNIFTKNITLIAYLFPMFRTGKVVVIQMPKISVSEDHSTTNTLNGPKHCWNLHDSTFIIMIDHCEGNWVGKSFSSWYVKSYDCLLTYCLPMTNFLFLIGTI